MINFIKILLSSLDNKHLRQLVILFVMIFFSIFLEMLGIGLIIPMINVIINNEYLEKFPLIINVLNYFGNPTNDKLLIYFIILFACVYLIKNIFLSTLIFIKTSFIFSVGNFYAKKLLKLYLKKPYSFHNENNSSKLINNLINETSLASGQFLLSIIDLIIEILLIIGIFFILFFVEPKLTIFVTFGFLFFALTYFLSVKKKILNYGYLRQITNNLRLKLYNETFVNIKFHLIYKKTEKLIKDIVDNLENIRTLNTRYIFFQHLPRYLLEFLVVIIFCIIILTFSYSKMLGVSNLVPTLALFSAAAYKILPSINKIIQRLQNLKFAKSAIKLISEELKGEINIKNNFETQTNKEKLKFYNLIINNVSFNYNKESKPIFSNISLEIVKGKIYGFIGPTGSGKSTLIDILMYLHNLEGGELILNNKINLKNRENDWHKLIGYVPQRVFLQDDSIKNNIAFGEHEYEINEENLLKSIRSSQLENFVLSLKDGLNTKVGENASKLSGGQIQRIGIARALYLDPEILFLDEITSSLDAKTEQEILSLIKSLKKEKTIIFITHNKSNLEICDEIYEVNNQNLIKKK